MKQTAVEYLVEQMFKGLEIDITKETNPALFNLIEQAKEMEKQQMIDFYVKGAEDWYDGFYKVDSAELYYNKTFKLK